eukprot:PhM_4_TR8412/c0_g1_i3/m.8110
MPIWNYLYRSTLNASDDFGQRVRKQAIAWGMVVVLASVIHISTVALRAVDEEWSPAQFWTSLLSTVMADVCFIIAWVQVKRSKTATDGVALFFALTLWAAFTIQVTQTYMYSFHAMSIALMSFSISVDIRTRLIIALYTILYVVNSYNVVVSTRSDKDDDTLQPIVVIPGSRDTVVGRLTVEVFNFVALFITIGVIQAQKKECDRMLEVAHSRTALAREIATDLVRYDTEAAKRRIVDDVDKESDFKGVLHTIVNNMEAYRPFLPNYLLNARTSSSFEDDDDDDDDEDTTKLSVFEQQSEECDTEPTSSMSCSLSQSQHPDEGMRFDHNTDEDPNAVVAFNIVPTVTMTAAREESSSTSDNPSSKKTSPLQVINNKSPLDASSGARSPGAPQLMMRNADIPLRKKVSLAILHVNPFAPTNATTTSTSVSSSSEHRTTVAVPFCVSAAKSHNLIDTLHEIADTTKAIVHSLYADTLQLSWNTARRVAQHEARAATFLARCRAQTGCVGAACTGEATFMLCGRKQVVPVVQCAWQGELSTLLWRYATPNNTIVCNEPTTMGLPHTLRSRAFAAFRFLNNNDATSSSSFSPSGEWYNTTDAVVPIQINRQVDKNGLILVFEIVQLEDYKHDRGSPRFGAVGDQEWMYVMSREQDVEFDAWCDAITEVTRLAANGSYEDAIHHYKLFVMTQERFFMGNSKNSDDDDDDMDDMNSVEDGDRVLTQCLYKRIVECQQQQKRGSNSNEQQNKFVALISSFN